MKWCDLTCQHASWPDSKDLSGACRTFQALWCNKLQRAVHKNAACQAGYAEHEEEAESPPTGSNNAQG